MLVAKKSVYGRRRLLAVCALPILGVLVLPSRLLAADTEAGDLIKRAQQLSDIRTAPFILKAHVKSFQPKPLEGTYILRWFNHSQWRSDLTIANATYSQVRNGDASWRSKDSGELASLQQQLAGLEPWSSLKIFSDERLRKVEQQQTQLIQLTCVAIEGDGRSARKLCVDAASGLLVGQKSAAGGEQFANYLSFRDKQFPQTWQRFVGPALALEVQVDEMAALEEADLVKALTPPPDSEPWSFCEDLRAPRVTYSPDPLFPEKARSEDKKEGLVVLWLVVRANGKPDLIKVARPAGYGFDGEAMAAVRQWRFRPGTCDGKPVDTQINVEVNFKLY